MTHDHALLGRVKQLHEVGGEIAQFRLMEIFEEVEPSDIADHDLSALYGTIRDQFGEDGEIIFTRPVYSGMLSAWASIQPGAAYGRNPDLIREVKDAARLRRAKQSAVQAAHAQTIDDAREMFEAGITALEGTPPKVEFDAQAVWRAGYQQAIDNRGKECIGIPTPFRQLNEYTAGAQPGHLWCLGGYTSSGKSTVANEMAYHAIWSGFRVAIFSLEMSVRTTMYRLAGRHAGVSALDISRGDFTKVQESAIDEAVERIKASGSMIFDDVRTVLGIRSRLRKLEMLKAKPDLVIVDFVQNIQGEGRSLYERMCDVSLKLQEIPIDYGTCLLALSQMSNESVREGRGGDIIGYKGGGELAAAADVALVISKDKENKGYSILDVRKHRHGPTGTLRLSWECNFTRLEERRY